MIDLRHSIYRRKGRKGWTLEYWEPGRPRPRQASRPTKTACEAEWERIKAERQATAGLAQDVRFEDYARTWQRRTRSAVAPATDAAYAWALDGHLLPALRHLTLRQITVETVKDLVAALRAPTPARPQGRLAKKSVSNVKGTLYSILESALEARIIPTNPAAYRGRSKLLKLTPSRAEKKAARRAMDADQLRAFFAVCEAEEPRHHVQWYAEWAIGARPGEVMALRPEDLDYRGNRIFIGRSVAQRRAGQAPHVRDTTKTGEQRWVDMAPGLKAMLRSWEARQKAEALASGRPRPALLFPGEDGKPQEHRQLERVFKRVLRRAGLPPRFRPHDLRHTFAVMALRAGKPIKWVQLMLGHASIQMTADHYGDHDLDATTDHAASVEGLLRARPETAVASDDV